MRPLMKKGKPSLPVSLEIFGSEEPQLNGSCAGEVYSALFSFNQLIYFLILNFFPAFGPKPIMSFLLLPGGASRRV